MRISAKTDYAIRAAVEIAAATPGCLVKAETIAQQQQIPLQFLSAILNELRHAGIVSSRRGQEGGYSLARDAGEVTIAAVIRAVDGPLADIAGTKPENLRYRGHAQPLQATWLATRAAIREVLDAVTLADVVNGHLPAAVTSRLDQLGF